MITAENMGVTALRIAQPDRVGEASATGRGTEPGTTPADMTDRRTTMQTIRPTYHS